MVEYGITPEHATIVTTEAMAMMFYAMAFSRAVREEVRKRQGSRCDSCDEKETPLPVHHKVPRSLGGSSTNIENAVGLCSDCHPVIDDETFGGREYPQVHTKEKYYPQGNGLSGDIYPTQPRK